MLNNQTITKLNEMRMATMAMGFAQQLQTAKYNELSFEERFSLLVDQDWQTRQINRVNHLVKQACFRFPEATIEDIDWNPKRKLDKSHILSLAGCTWINQHLNLIIDGKTGVGKSWMACLKNQHWLMLSSIAAFTTHIVFTSREIQNEKSNILIFSSLIYESLGRVIYSIIGGPSNSYWWPFVNHIDGLICSILLVQLHQNIQCWSVS